MKVLLVTADAAQAAALGARFHKRFPDALSFRHAKSVPAALSEMRAALPDIVIGARETEGVGALELLRRIRGESELDKVAVILLDQEVLAHLSPSRLETVLDADAHPAEVLEAAFGLLVLNGRYKEPRAFHGAFPEHAPAHTLDHFVGQRARSGRDVKVSGTLEVMTLFDLVLSLTQKRNCGRLYLLLGDTEALMVFQQGRFVHAEFGAHTGERAVLQTFLEAEKHPEAEFFFEPSAVGLPQGGVTLHTSVQELLLKVAVELDHQRERFSAGT